MKNKLFMKVGTIVILLLSLVVLMDGFQSDSSQNNFYRANAASGASKVQLVINEGTITCTGWLGTLNMGAVNAQFGSTTMSGIYGTNVWNCLDTKGSSTWGLTIRITGDLYGSIGGTSISSGAAAICQTVLPPALMQGSAAAPALTTTIPTCATTTGIVITQDLLRRGTANGQIYQYGITPKLLVTVPVNQAPGTYTGVIEIGIP